jgi:hypothetical protein
MMQDLSVWNGTKFAPPGSGHDFKNRHGQKMVKSSEPNLT